MLTTFINFGVRAQPTQRILRRTRSGSTSSCNCYNYSCNCQSCSYSCNCQSCSYECGCSTCQSCSTCESCSTCQSCSTCCGYVTKYTSRSYNSGGCSYIGGNQWWCPYQDYECNSCNCYSYSCNCSYYSCNCYNYSCGCSTCYYDCNCQTCYYDCNCQTCTACSTCCDWSGWSAWEEVAVCTASSPSCSNGAVQVECQIV